MNNEVIVRIDISTEAGRRVLLRLEKEESVKIEYPVLGDDSSQKYYSHEEVWNMLQEKLNDHYGTNYKFEK